jgi:hypothetical protein
MKYLRLTAILPVSVALAQAPPSLRDEAFLYSAEWRLMHAGNARISWSGNGPDRSASLHLVTAGLAGKLYKVDNHYSVSYNSGFCASSSVMKANEGKKRREIMVTYNRTPGKAEFVERDLLKNNDVVGTREVPVPACVHDTIAALGRLRTLSTAPGQTVELPISDGKKSANVRIQALTRETVKTRVGRFNTIRYEAHLFNDVIYRRKARLFVWLTDDARRLPVRVEIDMPFYIGNVVLELEKMDPVPANTAAAINR